MTDSTKNDTFGSGKIAPRLHVRFYVSDSGREPVRVWLRFLDEDDRRSMGRIIKKAQFGWPVGYPLVRKMGGGLWEIRGNLRDGVARIFFTLDGDRMVLVHGFEKKSQATPEHDLETARRRARAYRTAKEGKNEEESAPGE